MMPPLLVGVTHAIVTTCTEEVYKNTGVLAYVDLCIVEDGNAIRGIPYKKIASKVFAFQSPNTVQYRNGSKEVVTAFSGSIDTEICTKALRAMEHVKKLGKFKFNTRYRVSSVGAVEEPAVKG